jgi:hypothetical protein
VIIVIVIVIIIIIAILIVILIVILIRIRILIVTLIDITSFQNEVEFMKLMKSSMIEDSKENRDER